MATVGFIFLLNWVVGALEQQQQQDLDEQQFSKQAQDIAGGDSDFLLINKFVESETNLSIDRYLALDRFSYRVYQNEDKSLVTSVFFDHGKDQMCKDLLKIQDQIGQYIQVTFKGKKGTARLGFTTERELFGICKNMFGPELFGHGNLNQLTAEQGEHIMLRRIIYEIFEAIKLFRQVKPDD